MKRVLMLLVVLVMGSAAPGETVLHGAGASFPYPIYSRWGVLYEQQTGVKLDYQSIGSGGGIKAIVNGEVGFGASDAPLEPAELDKHGLLQFPLVIGGVVPVVNLPGIRAGEFRLSGEVLADIFLGEIDQWTDPRIVALNPNLTLPDKKITVVHRAKGSGTTWILTNYLSAVSPAWRERLGVGKTVDWPVGLAGSKNEGVAEYVQRVAGSIGYVEYAYALQQRMSYVLLQNRDGNYVAPTSATFQAAAANADWLHAPGYYLVLVDQPGVDTWPITGASFILMHKAQVDAANARAMLAFFQWCYAEGDALAEQLHYVPIPDNVVRLVEQNWAEQVYLRQPIWP